MSSGNPYAISFGRIPTQYISRTIAIDSIVDTLESDIIDEQAFKLTGIRGAGKTVTLTAIERKMREKDDWIVVGLRSNGKIIEDLIANLYSAVPFITTFIDANLNLSILGIGLNISNKSPVVSLDYSLKAILGEIAKNKKRLLVTIDEARKTTYMIDFIQEFQLLIREDLPIFLIAAGLYEDIESIENTEGLTFFLRASKYEMTPLNYTYIRNDYQKTLQVPFEIAEQMAFMTKGYAFAYQALGKYMWEEETKKITDDVMMKLDEALAEKVYRKIWSELAPRDKLFLKAMENKDCVSTCELLELADKKHNEWSEPRKRLADKGIIDIKTRGQIKMLLPRFGEFIKNNVFD